MRLALALVLAVGCKAPASGTESAAGTGTGTGTAAGTGTGTETGTRTGTGTGTGTGTATAGNAFLDAHNVLRARNCAPSLAWSDELEQVARAWAASLKARGCVLEHSANRYGENLAASTQGTLDPVGVTALWYAELSKYDFKHPAFSMATGHFTQLVWSNTRRLGCASVTCNGMDVWVCNYDPPGNVEGGYTANVKPTTCN
jgi:uncharacterized protein YkwD